MLSIRCQNSRKNKNTQTSEVDSNFLKKFVGNMTHHQNRQTFMILVFFTVPFYHFLISRYLVLAEHHFLSDILVPFPDSRNLYNHDINKNKHENMVYKNYNNSQINQALSGDFQCMCGKMHMQILLRMRWCEMSIFFF